MKQQPYIPSDRQLKYVSMQNKFMQEAMKFARKNSLHKESPVASVFVKGGKVVVAGANGSTYHDEYGCERRKMGIPHGEGYELCPGCSFENHSEAQAIKKAGLENINLRGSDVYMWGQWWCCEPCWNKMIAADVKDVYLLESAEIYFDGNDTDNKLADYSYFESLIKT